MEKIKDKLGEFIDTFDNISMDDSDSFKIQDSFQKIRDELTKEGNSERARIAQLEMELFSFNKSVKDYSHEKNSNNTNHKTKKSGYRLELSPRWSEKIRPPTGEESIISQWPDSTNYTDKEYIYFHQRFKITKSDFAKIEYGLFLLLDQKSKYKDDKIVISVLKSLYKSCIKYEQKIFEDVLDPNHFSLKLENALKQGFALSYSRKDGNSTIFNIFRKFSKYIYSSIIDWNLESKSTLRFIAGMARLIIYHKKEFNNHQLQKILDKIWFASQKLVKIYIHSSIDLANVGIDFANKIGLNEKFDWNRLIAKNYESLADDAKKNNTNVYSSFIEDALKWYKKAKDKEKIKELETEFFDAKNKMGFSTVKTAMPKEYINKFRKRADKFIKVATEKDVLITLFSTPMIAKLSEIKKQTDNLYKIAPLSALITKSVTDKMGNTVAVYPYDNKEELYKYNFLDTYRLDFQYALIEIEYLFIEAFKNKKLSAQSVLNFVNKSWLGQEFTRFYNGKEHSINLSNTLIETVTKIFEEIEKGIKDNTYAMILMASVDSLTVKFEYIFRFVAERLNISTYFSQPGQHNIKQEKSLNTLFEEKNLEEKFESAGLKEDLFFFKFILTEKAGWNLRNRVAHGLMDIDEYTYRVSIILIILVLKIASYNFKTDEVIT